MRVDLPEPGGGTRPPQRRCRGRTAAVAAGVTPRPARAGAPFRNAAPAPAGGTLLAGFARNVVAYLQADDAADGSLLAFFTDADTNSRRRRHCVGRPAQGTRACPRGSRTAIAGTPGLSGLSSGATPTAVIRSAAGRPAGRSSRSGTAGSTPRWFTAAAASAPPPARKGLRRRRGRWTPRCARPSPAGRSNSPRDGGTGHNLSRCSMSGRWPCRPPLSGSILPVLAPDTPGNWAASPDAATPDAGSHPTPGISIPVTSIPGPRLSHFSCHRNWLATCGPACAFRHGGTPCSSWRRPDGPQPNAALRTSACSTRKPGPTASPGITGPSHGPVRAQPAHVRRISGRASVPGPFRVATAGVVCHRRARSGTSGSRGGPRLRGGPARTGAIGSGLDPDGRARAGPGAARRSWATGSQLQPP